MVLVECFHYEVTKADESIAKHMLAEQSHRLLDWLRRVPPAVVIRSEVASCDAETTWTTQMSSHGWTASFALGQSLSATISGSFTISKRTAAQAKKENRLDLHFTSPMRFRGDQKRAHEQWHQELAKLTGADR